MSENCELFGVLNTPVPAVSMPTAVELPMPPKLPVRF